MNIPLDFSIKPLATWGPGRCFVDRENEMALVKAKLTAGGTRGGQIKSGVLSFWGAFGMGKSWLLRRIEQDYSFSQRQPEGADTHPAITARLDLSRKAVLQLWQNNQIDRELLIRELWKQFAEQLGAEVPDPPRASADDWASDFVKQVAQWALESCTPLILLDTVDDLIETDEDMFTWLEKHLVEPLAITDRVLFIFTSRGEIEAWERFQVRRRIDSRRLTAFDLKYAGEAIDAALPVSEYLYRVTFGHPYSNERLASIFERTLKLNLKNPEDFDQPIDEDIIKSVLSRVVQEVLRVLPEPLISIAWAMSVLRWVSVEPLRGLCEKTKLVPEGRGEAYYLDDLIGIFQAHHLIYWMSEQNCYEMDPTLRRLLAYALQLNQPQLYALAHQAAYEFHQEHLNNYPSYLSRYVPELAFHLAARVKLTGETDLGKAFTSWWNNFPAPKPPPTAERWDELTQALQADLELKKTLPEDLFTLLAENHNHIRNPMFSRADETW